MAVKGSDYYFTPLERRPFRADYAAMKPSGPYSHSLGIYGSLMVIVGVATYSTRKRHRSLRDLGKLSRWLEFHIFLCLVGPIMIVFHTTFKAGGIASISLWTMLSVVASGLIGRYLYVLIPRNLMGAQLSSDEIMREIDRLGATLKSHPLGPPMIALIDQGFSRTGTPENLRQTISTILRMESAKRRTNRRIRELIRANRMAHSAAKPLQDAAMARVSLLQRSAALREVQKFFFYWHAIHFPFSIIMFVTLAAHVTVSILLGYTWVL